MLVYGTLALLLPERSPLLLGQPGSKVDKRSQLFFYSVLNLHYDNKALFAYSPASALNLIALQSPTLGTVIRCFRVLLFTGH